MRLRPAPVGVAMRWRWRGVAGDDRPARRSCSSRPWLSLACVMFVGVVFGRAAWQTASMVTLARRAVERAALNAGMTPVPMRRGRRAALAVQPAPRRDVAASAGAGAARAHRRCGAHGRLAARRRHALTLVSTGRAVGRGVVVGRRQRRRRASRYGARCRAAATSPSRPTATCCSPTRGAASIHRFDVAGSTIRCAPAARRCSDDRRAHLIAADWRIDSPASVAVGRQRQHLRRRHAAQPHQPHDARHRPDRHAGRLRAPRASTAISSRPRPPGCSGRQHHDRSQRRPLHRRHPQPPRSHGVAADRPHPTLAGDGILARPAAMGRPSATAVRRCWRT